MKLDKLYGGGWNVYLAEGRYWSVCSHKPGSNLTFAYRGVVYGVFQTPSDEDLMDEPSRNSLYDSEQQYCD